jgi:hypothetical protein
MLTVAIDVERTCCARLDSARFPEGSGLFPFDNLSFSESDFAGLLTALSKAPSVTEVRAAITRIRV